jgi:hypothetical protein
MLFLGLIWLDLAILWWAHGRDVELVARFDHDHFAAYCSPPTGKCFGKCHHWRPGAWPVVLFAVLLELGLAFQLGAPEHARCFADPFYTCVFSFTGLILDSICRICEVLVQHVAVQDQCPNVLEFRLSIVYFCNCNTSYNELCCKLVNGQLGG